MGHPDRSWWLPENSEVRQVAMQIIAMRISGLEDPEIATSLGLSKNSIAPYVYRATKNGWLDISYNPKDRLQFQTMHKVVQALEDSLDSRNILATGLPERTHTALKMAEGTIFKQFGDVQQQTQQNTVVSVQVIMPEGPRQMIRADTTGGTPAYVDAIVEGA